MQNGQRHGASALQGMQHWRQRHDGLDRHPFPFRPTEPLDWGLLCPQTDILLRHRHRFQNRIDRYEKVALITDGRFSGATRGFCIGHVGPEAADCGPIALVEEGDIITIDAALGVIDLQVDDAILAERLKAWQPRSTDYGAGALWRFAQNVGPAYKGAVTHPGGKYERHCYADI